MRRALSAADLRQKDVALSTQGSKVLLERTHPLPDLSHPPLQLGFVECAEVVWHGHECTAQRVFQLRR